MSNSNVEIYLHNNIFKDSINVKNYEINQFRTNKK